MHAQLVRVLSWLCLATTYTGQYKTKTDMILPVSPKVGLSNDCLSLMCMMLSHKPGGLNRAN